MIQLNQSNPIADDQGKMTNVMRQWVTLVNNWQPIVGTGTPEGVVEAPLYAPYIDDTIPAVSGSILYLKMQDEIGGDKTKGWVAI